MGENAKLVPHEFLSVLASVFYPLNPEVNKHNLDCKFLGSLPFWHFRKSNRDRLEKILEVT